MRFRINSISAKSPSHSKNQDSFICRDNFIVIADGMGGEACGEIASAIAVAEIDSHLSERLTPSSSEEEVREMSMEAIARADKEILRYIAEHKEAERMGTTVLLAVLQGRNLYLSWCGDSRAYHYSTPGKLTHLTADHSYVQQLIDEGTITAEESFSHPDNNIITRHVGGGKNICIPEFTSRELDATCGCVILCSDGLSGYCRDKEIASETSRGNHADLPRRLLKLALRQGSADDITIVTLTPARPRLLTRLLTRPLTRLFRWLFKS